MLGIGRATRFMTFSSRPAPMSISAGVVDRHTIHLRTYERGVEGETLAGGSGSIAAALIAALVHKVESPVTVVPKSGLPLSVMFRRDGDRFTDVTLTGEARAIYDGLMRPDAWEYELL